MTIYTKNLQHGQKLQKWYKNKHAMSKSYALCEKLELNRKYIKTKN